jgi:hypothetical protein
MYHQLFPTVTWIFKTITNRATHCPFWRFFPQSFNPLSQFRGQTKPPGHFIHMETPVLSDLARALQRDLHAPGTRLTFIVKVLMVVNFVAQYPNEAAITGAFWGPDKRSIISNARILANFMNITSSGMNKNFRQHRFSNPMAISEHRLKQAAPPEARNILTNVRTWKIRQHETAALHADTSAEVAAELDRHSWADFRFQQLQGQALDRPGADHAREQWETTFGRKNAARRMDVVNAFFLARPDEPMGRNSQLRTNFQHLCALHSDEKTLMEGMISLLAFTEFFLRYGSPTGADALLEEVTSTDAAADVPRFHCGVCLGANPREFWLAWLGASTASWAIIEGHEPGTLLLLTTQRIVDQRTDRPWTVSVNPIGPVRLAMTNAQGELVQATGVRDLLQHLNLPALAGLNLGETGSVRNGAWPVATQEAAAYEDFGWEESSFAPDGPY